MKGRRRGGYRSTALNAYGDRCLHCGSSEDVKVHHMDGDRSNDRRDNWVPLCQSCHTALHRAAPPYTIWLPLGDPVIRAIDRIRREQGYRDRGETISRGLLALCRQHPEALSYQDWALLSSYLEGVLDR